MTTNNGIKRCPKCGFYACRCAPTAALRVNWRVIAEGMLDIERQMRPFHRPPSMGCIVTWRDRMLVGMIQFPVDPRLPAVVYLSVTSKYYFPEFANAIRKADPGRLELVADEGLDLTGNFHILRREDNRLTYLTAEETEIAQSLTTVFAEVDPGDQTRKDAFERAKDRESRRN